MKAREHFVPLEEIEAALEELRAAIAERDLAAAMQVISNFVREYRPASPTPAEGATLQSPADTDLVARDEPHSTARLQKRRIRSPAAS